MNTIGSLVMNHKDIKYTIIKLLNNLGTESEVKKYLKRFSDPRIPSFAIIKIGGAIIQNDLDNIASAISFLQQVGLKPIIVHGAGPQLNQMLDEHGITPHFIDGKRVTSSDVLHLARKVFIQQNQMLVNAFDNIAINATSITSGLLNCRLADSTLGLVGQIQSINLELLTHALKRGSIPIISPLGETDSGQIVNINADSVTLALAKQLKPYKIIFLTETGGILDDCQNIIPVINLNHEYSTLMQSSWLHSGMRFKLKMIKDILDALPKSTSISITTPGLLAKELFTHKGSGTLIIKGEVIHEFDSWQSIEPQVIRRLINSSFNKKLDENYFATTPLEKLYLTDCQQGLAIVSAEFPIPYLDKYCVSASAKGEGIGSNLWQRLTHDYPTLFWRAKRHNPINQFYRKKADGFQNGKDWCVYWLGDITPQEIPLCIEWANNKPITIGHSNHDLEECKNEINN